MLINIPDSKLAIMISAPDRHEDKTGIVSFMTSFGDLNEENEFIIEK